MKKKDKIEWLKKYHPEKWYTVRSEIKNKLSDAQHIFLLLRSYCVRITRGSMQTV